MNKNNYTKYSKINLQYQNKTYYNNNKNHKNKSKNCKVNYNNNTKYIIINK